MRKWIYQGILLLAFAAELAALFLFAGEDAVRRQDAVAVNEALQSVQDDWEKMKEHKNQTGLDYVVIDANGAVCFRTREGLGESVNDAVLNRDTILDVASGKKIVGKLLISNDSNYIWKEQKRAAAMILAAAVCVQWMACIGYGIYLKRTVIKPFEDLKGFAERVAGGNLDVPLAMDRHNCFGAFTESFDLMRAELKKARIAEARANASKKELVAQLSHDIKTPVASIKAAAEVGAALAGEARIRSNYAQIISKADEVNILITNLFTSALEELEELKVMPADLESRELTALLERADYLHRARIPAVPSCLLFADRLRLQQVFDNIFANSYKYANTEIETAICRRDGTLDVTIRDYGGGVSAEELPALKEKFRRGSNAGQVEGAGLGLYICDYFMKQMHGEIILCNGQDGLEVTVRIPLSGVS